MPVMHTAILYSSSTADHAVNTVLVQLGAARHLTRPLTVPQYNGIPVNVLCTHAKHKTLTFYWSTKMDNVKLELLTTNNNKGYWEKEKRRESCALVSFISLPSSFLSALRLPCVLCGTALVLSSVCSFDSADVYIAALWRTSLELEW
jgi:hypothetical protein